MLFCLSFFSSGVPVKPINVAFGRSSFMALCSLPDWVRWASSTKTKSSPLAWKPSRRLLCTSWMKASTSPSSDAAELLHQRAHQPLLVLLQDAEEVGAAAGAVDLLVDAEEDLLDLLVELGAVGDDHDAGVLDVLADPLGEPHHRQALAAALGMPDDAALPALDVRLRGAHPEVLVVAAGLLRAGIEDHEVVHDLQQPLRPADLVQAPQERILRRLVRGCIFLPVQPVLLGRLDDRVAQALGGVPGQDELHRREEGPDELLLLVVERLPDALVHRDGGALQLQHPERDAVHVEHHVRALGVLPDDRDLLGHPEVVLRRVPPSRSAGR